MRIQVFTLVFLLPALLVAQDASEDHESNSSRSCTRKLILSSAEHPRSLSVTAVPVTRHAWALRCRNTLYREFQRIIAEALTAF
jgi:hypothetical protein